ncbi:hypothetical protein Tco_1177183, partial [Tanacetum coccineum]
METIGIPPDKHETDENEEGKTLSAGKSSEVSAKLFQKAHLYLIHNTDELVPYIEVIGESPEEKVRHLISVKAEEQKPEEIVVVRNFLEVFPNNLSGLPPTREIEFRIEFIPGSIPVAKSPYRLAPSEMEELSGQLRELQD